MRHNVKVLSKKFKEIQDGESAIALKEKENQFRLGDEVTLKEYLNGEYTGREVSKTIKYITDNSESKVDSLLILA